MPLKDDPKQRSADQVDRALPVGRKEVEDHPKATEE